MRLRVVNGVAEILGDDGVAVMIPEDVDLRDGEAPLSMSQRRTITAAYAALEARLEREREERFELFQRSPEERAQGETTDSAGGYLVAQTFARQLEVSLKQADALFAAARLVETDTGGPFPFPLDDDTGNVATLVSESGTSTATDTIFDRVLFGKCPNWRSGLVRASVEIVQDSAFDLAGLLAGAFARRFARGVGAAFTTTLLSGADVAVTSASPTAVTVDEAIDLTAALDASYAMRGSFLMRFATYQAFLKQKGSTGGSYLVAPEVDAEGYPLLLGRRVYLSPSMPAIASTAKAIAFGDVTKFLRRQVRGGMVMRKYVERYAEFGQVAFEANLRIDGALARATNAPVPIRLLQCHS